MVQLLRLPEVCRRVGLSKSTIYALIGAGDFPAPVPISARCRAWPNDRIDEWAQTRIAKGEAAMARQTKKRGGAGPHISSEAPVEKLAAARKHGAEGTAHGR